MNQKQAFEEVAWFFEANDNEHLTVRDFVNMMSEFLGDSEEPVDSQLYMKRLVKERFDDGVAIAETDGKASVVTLRPTAQTILWNFNVQPNDSDENQKKMKKMSCLCGCWVVEEDPDDLKNLEKNLNYLPQTLKFFPENLFVGKDTKPKIAAIGQSIMQATWPMAVKSPLQVGLAVKVHHQWGSRSLVDTLSAMGFCSSYYETSLFERNASVSANIEIQGLQGKFCMHHVANNVDLNVTTIDGRNTIRAMGL